MSIKFILLPIKVEFIIIKFVLLSHNMIYYFKNAKKIYSIEENCIKS